MKNPYLKSISLFLSFILFFIISNKFGLLNKSEEKYKLPLGILSLIQKFMEK